MAEELMQNIQWFPGHMTKTRRMIAANLSLVDAVVEILDARIPRSSRNPEMDRMVGTKPRLLLLNKADMADPAATSRWIQAYRKENRVALAVDCRSGKGISGFAPAVRQQLLRELLEKRQAHGMSGAPIRLMVVGIPNVGKSSFINRMAQSKRAKVEDRPGVTRTKQWVKIGNQMELLDMPGVLWKKFDSKTIASNLAFIGSIKDDILDVEELAMNLLDEVRRNYPDLVAQRYKLDAETLALPPYELLEAIGRKRGLLVRGGEVNTERCAIMLVDEFRACKWGRISLERPPQRDDLTDFAGEDEE